MTTNTKPSDWLQTDPGTNSLLLSARPGHEVLLVDASCQASVAPGRSDWQASFYLAPKQESRSIIAVKVRASPGTNSGLGGELRWLLQMSFNSHLTLNLGTPFIPGADCLAQLERQGLFVQAGGRLFKAENLTGLSPDHVAAIRREWSRQGIDVVGTPGLLCELLAGNATLDQVAKDCEWHPPQEQNVQDRYHDLQQDYGLIADQLRTQAAQTAAALQVIRAIGQRANVGLGGRKQALRNIRQLTARKLANMPEYDGPII